MSIKYEDMYIEKGVFEYFYKNNFERLLLAHEEAKANGKKLYVGIYSDEVLEKYNKQRRFRDIVPDKARIDLVEALDFVEGAFIIDSLSQEKIKETAVERANRKRKDTVMNLNPKYNVGFASGGFDCLHPGHIQHLRDTKAQCNKLIIGVNSDTTIRQNKNKIPMVDEETRKIILQHIKYVDATIIVSDYCDKMNLYEKSKELSICKGKGFDAIFAGSDWRGSKKWEKFAKDLKEVGVNVIFTERPENGISSSKIKKSNEDIER